MNFYEHHLGDYVRDTAHLSMLEDGCYRRLLDCYYVREAPLPREVKEVQRLVRAASAAERKAVETVLREFFVDTEEGWRHKRCDVEIARYLDAEPGRESKRENERERQRRSRERRRHLFDALRAHGVVPAYDASMTELQAALDRVTSPQSHAPVTRDVTGSHFPLPTSQTQELPSPPDFHVSATPRARARPPDVPRETFRRIRETYPRGIFRDADWLIAEREIGNRVGEGVPLADLVAATADYALQQAAKGSVGTQFVLNPAKFFNGSNAWRGPFPLPASQRAPARESDYERLMRLNGGAPDPTTVIEHDSEPTLAIAG